VVETERWEREKVVEVARMKKALEESNVENSMLRTEKATIEVELDKTMDAPW